MKNNSKSGFNLEDVMNLEEKGDWSNLDGEFEREKGGFDFSFGIPGLGLTNFQGHCLESFEAAKSYLDNNIAERKKHDGEIQRLFKENSDAVMKYSPNSVYGALSKIWFFGKHFQKKYDEVNGQAVGMLSSSTEQKLEFVQQYIGMIAKRAASLNKARINLRAFQSKLADQYDCTVETLEKYDAEHQNKIQQYNMLEKREQISADGVRMRNEAGDIERKKEAYLNRSAIYSTILSASFIISSLYDNEALDLTSSIRGYSTMYVQHKFNLGALKNIDLNLTKRKDSIENMVTENNQYDALSAVAQTALVKRAQMANVESKLLEYSCHDLFNETSVGTAEKYNLDAAKNLKKLLDKKSFEAMKLLYGRNKNDANDAAELV